MKSLINYTGAVYGVEDREHTIKAEAVDGEQAADEKVILFEVKGAEFALSPNQPDEDKIFLLGDKMFVLKDEDLELSEEPFSAPWEK